MVWVFYDYFDKTIYLVGIPDSRVGILDDLLIPPFLFHFIPSAMVNKFSVFCFCFCFWLFFFFNHVRTVFGYFSRKIIFEIEENRVVMS